MGIYFPCKSATLPNESVSQEHMKMMQMPYFNIWSMLLSGQVPHRTNSSQLFWNRLFQKKKPSRVCVCVLGQGGGGLGRTFFEKNPGIVLVFSVPPGNFR